MSRDAITVLNEGNPNKVPAAMQKIRAGSALNLLPKYAGGEVASDLLTLPNNAKAAAVLSGYAGAGTTTGFLSAAAPGATPATTEVGVSPTGDIEFAAADAVTDAQVVYVAAEGELVSEEVAVDAAGVAAPLANRKASILISADLTSGDVPGAKTVIARGGTPATGEVAINDEGSLAFLAADVGASGGRASVVYVARPGVGSVSKTLGDLLTEVDTTSGL